MRTGLMAFMAFILALATVALAGDPQSGTWQLNVSKSQSTGPASRSETVKIEGQDHAIIYTNDRVDADGKSYHGEFSAKYDGKDYPVVAGGQTIDAVALKRIDANTVEQVMKKDGKVFAISRWVISSDGKVRTVTTTRKDEKGQDVTSVRVWDKQ